MRAVKINTQVLVDASRIHESINAMEPEPANAENGTVMNLKGVICQAIFNPPSPLSTLVNGGKTLDERMIAVNFGVDLAQGALNTSKTQMQNLLEQLAGFAEKCSIKELADGIAEVQTVLKESLKNLSLTNLIDPVVNAIYAIDNLQGKLVGSTTDIEIANPQKPCDEITIKARNFRQWTLEVIEDMVVRGVIKIRRAGFDQAYELINKFRANGQNTPDELDETTLIVEQTDNSSTTNSSIAVLLPFKRTAGTNSAIPPGETEDQNIAEAQMSAAANADPEVDGAMPSGTPEANRQGKIFKGLKDLKITRKA